MVAKKTRRPKTAEEDRVQRRTLLTELPMDLFEQVAARADKEDRTLSSCVRLALKLWMGEDASRSNTTPEA